MKPSSILAAAGVFARGALSTCELGGALAGRTCEWQGTSPACGGAEAGLELGQDTAGGEQLVAWTREHSWSKLFKPGTKGVSGDSFELIKPLLPCKGEYGANCLGGYKRLVCKGEKIPPETLKAMNTPLVPCAKDEEVCVQPGPEEGWTSGADVDSLSRGETVGLRGH